MRNRAVRVFHVTSKVLKHGNFGDELAAPILERLFGLRSEAVSMREAELLCVGSILDRHWRFRQYQRGWRNALKRVLRPSARELHVWGAGAMEAESRFEWPQKLTVHAVRGPLTSKRLPGFSGPLGDPGILVSQLWPKRPATTQVVLVPHFVDEARVGELDLPPGWAVAHVDRPIDDVIAAISAAELVVASSLHGLIAADAYGIPAVWASTEGMLSGGNSLFKFADHAAARAAEFNEPITYSEAMSMSVSDLADRATTAGRSIEDWQKELVAAFPSAFFR